MKKPNQEISWRDEKEGGYGRNRYRARKHFDTTLICKLSTPLPDKFACCTHRIGRSKDRRDSTRSRRNEGREGRKNSRRKKFGYGFGPESSFAVHKAVQRDSLSHFNFPRMNIEVSLTRGSGIKAIKLPGQGPGTCLSKLRGNNSRSSASEGMFLCSVSRLS